MTTECPCVIPEGIVFWMGGGAAAFIKDIYEQLKCEIDRIVDNVTVSMLNLGVVIEVLCKVGGMC